MACAQDADAKKKAREEQAEREFVEALKKREEKMWEKSRQKRVNGWRAWESSGARATAPRRARRVLCSPLCLVPCPAARAVHAARTLAHRLPMRRLEAWGLPSFEGV